MTRPGSWVRLRGRPGWCGLPELRDLVLPVQCAGCGGTGARWCARCAAQVRAPAVRRLADGLLVVSAGAYDAGLREALNVWKDHGRADLSASWAPLLGAALSRLGAPPDAALVPVPSALRSRRRRGREPVREVCLMVGRAAGLAVLPALRQGRLVQDQAGLGAGQRTANLQAALVCVPGWRRRLAGRPVVLVDDIVTSGATLVEAARALRGGGAVLHGAVTVAATARRIGLADLPDG